MRTSYKNFFKIALFMILLFGLLAGISKLFTPAWNHPVFDENPGFSINKFHNLKKNKIQAFFVGTSHMEFSVDPMRIYENQGIAVYNIATSGQPIAATYFFTEEIFKRGYKPKVVIMDVSNLFIETCGAPSYRYILDSSLPSKSWRDLAKALIYDSKKNAEDSGNPMTDLQIRKLKLGIALPLYNYHSRWNQLNSSDFHFYGEKYFSQGYFANPYMAGSDFWTDELVEWQGEQKIKNTLSVKNGYKNGIEFSSSDEQKPPYVVEIPERNARYLRKIKNVCDSNGCKLLLVKIPVQIGAADYDSSWTMKRHETVETFAKSEGLEFLDMNYGGPEINWTTDTSDWGRHLNIRGAVRVSDFFGDYLVKHCGLVPETCKDYEEKEEVYNRYHLVSMLVTSTSLTEYISLLHQITETFNDVSVYMSAKDDMRSSLSEEEMNALHSLGLQTDFAAMSYNDSFIASIRDGKVLYECRSTRRQEYTENGGKNLKKPGARKDSKVVIKSRGYLDGNLSSIAISGKEYSYNSRGLNIVVYDNKSHIVLDCANFDTWANPHRGNHTRQENLYKFQDYLLYGGTRQ